SPRPAKADGHAGRLPTMICETCHNAMSAWVDGELGPDEREAFEKHLESCAACRAQADRLQVILQDLHHLPTIPAPATVGNKALAFIEAQNANRKDWYRPLRALGDHLRIFALTGTGIAVAATLLLAVVSGGYLLYDEKIASRISADRQHDEQ